MAKIINTYTTDEGHEINEYESGAAFDMTAGRLIRGSDAHKITAEKSTYYKRRRKEKAAAALRAALVDEHGRVKGKIAGPAAAVGAAGGLLWGEIVLNDKAYPRDRLDAWLKIGAAAGLLGEDPAEAGEIQQVTKLTEALTELIRSVREKTNGAGGVNADVIDVDAG